MSPSVLQEFVGVMTRELPELVIDAGLDGSLTDPPSEPRSAQPLRIIDQAALFVAPKTNYFLCSDLKDIAEGDDSGIGALAPLVKGPGDEPVVQFSDAQLDSARIVFPFPSNRQQRKVALVVEDESTYVVHVEGPPGTGKSLTIANLACHLAASGKRVLITSQKDKALDVVDSALRSLGLAELPMTLLRRDKESKRYLLDRLEQIDRAGLREEIAADYLAKSGDLEQALGEQVADAERYAQAILAESEIEKTDRALALTKGLRRMAARRKVASALRHARTRCARHGGRRGTPGRSATPRAVGAGYRLLRLGLQRNVTSANQAEIQVIELLKDTLRLNQTSHRNFSFFDQMKKDLNRATRLLRSCQCGSSRPTTWPVCSLVQKNSSTS